MEICFLNLSSRVLLLVALCIYICLCVFGFVLRCDPKNTHTEVEI